MKRSVITTGVVAALLVAADLVAKWTALQTLPTGRVLLLPGIGNVVPIDIAALTLHKNLGIIANIPLPLWFVIPFTILFLIGAYFWAQSAWQKHQQHLVQGIVVLWLGALGNLVDRIAHGFTTDYLLLFNRSAVNIADGLIVVGILWILIASYAHDQKQA